MTERFLLDTNVLSELARPEPDPAVLDWLRRLPSPATSSVCVFELSRGIELLSRGRRRAFLEAWLAELLATLEVIDFDEASALHAARIEVAARREGRAVETRDLFVVATALRHDRTIASRNVAHLSGLGCTLVDPFTGSRTR